MDKIKKYVIKVGKPSELETEVQNYIDDGWQPFGSLQRCVVENHYPAGGVDKTNMFLQPIVKYE